MANTPSAIANYLREYFLTKIGNNTLKGHLFAAEPDTYDLGSSANPFRAVYATSLVGVSGSSDEKVAAISGATPGYLDTVLAVNTSYLSKNVASGVITLSMLKAPLWADGTIALTGNLAVNSGVTIDGVDVSVLKSDYDAHIITYNAHVINADAHHAKQHSITDAANHTVTGSQYSVVGLTATNTLGILASTADGSANLNTLLRSNGSGNLKLTSLTTATIDSTSSLTFAPATNIIVTPAATNGVMEISDNKGIKMGSASFVSGFAGAGSRWDYGITNSGKYTLTVEDLVVRGSMYVYELLIQQIRATNGSLFVTDSAKIISVTGTGPYTMTVDGKTNDYQPFAVNDKIRAQKVYLGSGIQIKKCDMTVTAINVGANPKVFTATLVGGTDAPESGMDFVRLGNSSDTARQGGIYLTSSDSGAPFIDIVDGIAAHSDWNTSAKNKVRLGKLSGITDTTLNPSGYGLYSSNAFLKGTISAANDTVRIDADGIRVKQAVGNFDDISSYRFENSSSVLIGGLYGGETAAPYVIGGGGPIPMMNAIDAVCYPGTYGSRISVTAHGDVGTYQGSEVEIVAKKNARNVWINLQQRADGVTGGEIWFGGDTGDFISNWIPFRATEIIEPYFDVGISLGSASKRWSVVYADQIIASSISGAAMSGATWQYDGSMVINPNSSAATTLSIANNGTGTASLSVEGNITLGGTVDGVDIANLNINFSNLSSDFSTHTSDVDAHHTRDHVFASTSGLGATHTVSGLTAGQVLKATSATTALFVQLAHSELSGLTTGDPHTQYVSNGTARTITAVHTFNPTVAGAWITLGANATGQLITGLNADLLDGYDSAAFPRKAENATISGAWTFNADLTLATLTTSGVINAAINTDTAHRLGNAVVGYTGASTYAGFAAYGFNTATDYAIMQSSGGGDVFLNVPSSGIGHIRAGTASDIFTWSSGGLTSVGSAYIASDNYVSGWAGSGFRIDQNLSVVSSSFAEFDNLSIRGTMSVYELLINQIRATNGTLFVTASGKIESISGSVWTLEDPTGNSLCPFAVNDLVIIQRVDTNSTTIVQRIVRRVISVTGKSITVATASGGPVDTGTVAVGDTVVRFGNSATAARQGSVLLTSDMSNSPYIDIINGVTSWADWTGGTKTKMRIGLLTGVTGISNEYGFVAGNGFTAADSYIKASSSAVVQNNVTSNLYSSGVEQIRISPTSGIDLNIGTNPFNSIDWYNGMGGVLRSRISAFTDGSYGALDLTAYSTASTSYLATFSTRADSSYSYFRFRAQDATYGTTDSYLGAAGFNINSDELILTGLGASERISINNGFKNRSSTDTVYNTSEISNDDVTYKALMLTGNKSYDGTNRLVNIYDKLFISSILEVGQGRTTGNVSLFTGRNSTTSSISLTATSWGNGAAIGFNAYHANDSITPVASGAFKFLGTQYTGNVTRPGLQFWDGNSGTFAWYYGEAALASGANITTWTKSFQINTTNAISYNPMYIQGATGQYELLRLHGGGTGAANACYLSFYDNAGTTRYGHVGDPATGDSNIALRAEVGNLLLGDSVTSSAITIAGGNVTIANQLTSTGVINASSGIVQAGQVSSWSTAGWGVGLKMAGQGYGIMWPKGAGATSRLIGATNNGTFYIARSAGDDALSSVTYDLSVSATGDVSIAGKIGFYGVTPVARPTAYTQTYAAATRTHDAPTATNPAAYAAGSNGYSTAAIASAVHAAVIAHTNDIANIKQIVNSIIDDLQANGMFQ